jgi:hypothetical protein
MLSRRSGGLIVCLFFSCRALLHLSPFYSLVVDPSAVAFMHIYNGLLLAQELEEEDKEKDTEKEKDKENSRSKSRNKSKSKDKEKDKDRVTADGVDLFSCAAATFSLEEVRVWMAKQSSAAQLKNGMLDYCRSGDDRMNHNGFTIRRGCRRRRQEEEEEDQGGQDSVHYRHGCSGGQLRGPAHPGMRFRMKDQVFPAALFKSWLLFFSSAATPLR